ncbi:AI-2E family transporter [Adlercreutzia sp. ZJ304]|uniref:AI-2E family transporter n=1 Tax=Adlercreutzia sp. ZJ304 TaxID=2709791 RepID=UPI0013EAB614|nr:AI-2E family transporter [Adlercreutzia sp. ZJ304]
MNQNNDGASGHIGHIEELKATGLQSKKLQSLPNFSGDRVRKWFMGVWTAIGAIILVGVIVYLLNVLALPVSMLIWTLVFIFCLRGLVNGFGQKMNRALATTLAYVVMFVLLAIVGILMFSPMFGLNSQFVNLLESVPVYIADLTRWLSETYSKYSTWLENDTVRNMVESVGTSVSSWASSMASGAANTVVDIGASVANAFMAIGFAMVVAFWILMELPDIKREAKRLISPKFYDDAEFLHITFTRIIGGYIKGMFLQCLLIGVACGFLFAALGIPNAPALGVITGITNIVPIVGPWIGGIIAAIPAIFVSPLTAVVAIVGLVIIQWFVYTFVSPRIMSSSVDVHPALTLVAMMFGSAIGGAMSGLLGSLVGMLLAIPAVAVIKACFVYYFEKHTGRQAVSADGVFFRGTPHEVDGEAHPLSDATSARPYDESKDSFKAKLKGLIKKKDKQK